MPQAQNQQNILIINTLHTTDYESQIVESGEKVKMLGKYSPTSYPGKEDSPHYFR